MDISTVALVLSTCLSTASIAIAWIAYRHAQSIASYQSWPFEKIVAVEATTDEHEVQLTQLHERLRRVNARLAARDRRQRGTRDDDDELETKSLAHDGITRRPEESELEWKRRMRLEIAKGRLGHGG